MLVPASHGALIHGRRLQCSRNQRMCSGALNKLGLLRRIRVIDLIKTSDSGFWNHNFDGMLCCRSRMDACSSRSRSSSTAMHIRRCATHRSIFIRRSIWMTSPSFAAAASLADVRPSSAS